MRMSATPFVLRVILILLVGRGGEGHPRVITLPDSGYAKVRLDETLHNQGGRRLTDGNNPPDDDLDAPNISVISRAAAAANATHLVHDFDSDKRRLAALPVSVERNLQQNTRTVSTDEFGAHGFSGMQNVESFWSDFFAFLIVGSVFTVILVPTCCASSKQHEAAWLIHIDGIADKMTSEGRNRLEERQRKSREIRFKQTFRSREDAALDHFNHAATAVVDSFLSDISAEKPFEFAQERVHKGQEEDRAKKKARRRMQAQHGEELGPASTGTQNAWLPRTLKRLAAIGVLPARRKHAAQVAESHDGFEKEETFAVASARRDSHAREIDEVLSSFQGEAAEVNVTTCEESRDDAHGCATM